MSQSKRKLEIQQLPLRTTSIGKKIPNTNDNQYASSNSEASVTDEPEIKKLKHEEQEEIEIVSECKSPSPEPILEMFVPHKSFEALLNCPLCSKRYNKLERLPRIIIDKNCEQTACSECISKLHEQCLFTCPLCSGKHERPESGVSSYPSNKLVLNLLEIQIVRIDSSDLKATQMLEFKEKMQLINTDFESLKARMDSHQNELKNYLMKQCDLYMQKLKAKTNLHIQELDNKSCENFKSIEMAKEKLEHKFKDYMTKTNSKSTRSNEIKLVSDYLIKKMDQIKKSLETYESNSVIKTNLDHKEKIIHEILVSIASSTTEPDNNNKATLNTTESKINKINVTKLKFQNESLINYKSIYALSQDKIFFFNDDILKNIKSFSIVDDDMEEIVVQTTENKNLSIVKIRGAGDDNLFIELIDKITNLTYLAHYDGKFHKFKTFDTKSRRLHYVNKDEIILYSNKKSTQLFTVLKQTLCKDYMFGQSIDETQPFYFKNRDVQILGIDSSKIIIRYKTDSDTLLVLSRENGTLLNKIELTRDLENTGKISADIENVQVNDELQCIVVFREDMLLRVFNADGELLCNIKLTMSNDYDRFNVTKDFGIAFYYLSQNEIQHLKYESLLSKSRCDRED